MLCAPSMNKLSWVVVVAVFAACGPAVPLPCAQLDRAACGTRSDCTMSLFGQAETAFVDCQPLPLPACEGLSDAQCSTRSDCRVEQLACLAICIDDGRGGCLPCPQQTRCVTVPPTQPPACSTLDIATCRTRTDCAVEGGSDETGFGDPCFCDPSQGECNCQRPSPERCVALPPPACETLDLTTCTARPDCHVASTPVCDCINCGCDVATSFCATGPRPCGELDVNTCSTRRDCRIEYGTGTPPHDEDCPVIGGCQRPAPIGVCVDAGPIACWQLDAMSCSGRGDCELHEVTACPACLPGEACPPCTTTLVCDDRRIGDSCTGLDLVACSARTDCLVEEVTACPSCLPGGPCPPCESQFLCVERPVVDACTGLGVAACNVRPDCVLEEVGVCSACLPGAMCPPCTTTQVCVSRPVVDTCSALDVVECSQRSECRIDEVTVCPACAPGSSCPPCTTTSICSPIGQPTTCYGLDPIACSSNPSCVLDAWACTADCRDDGDGGCLPCEVPPPSCRPAGDGVPPPVVMDGGIRGP